MSSEDSLNASLNDEKLVLIWMNPYLKKKHWCLLGKAFTSGPISNHLFHHGFFSYQFCLDITSIQNPSDINPSGDTHLSNLLRAPSF